jgi:UDP-N-acetylglucosamine 4,6-dehydratase/5-epimerase
VISNLAERIEGCFRGKVVLITGGAGTVGSAVAERLIPFGPKSLRLLDHNEEKAFYLDLRFRDHENVRVLLGDVRDKNRMERALQDVDILIHTAALKHVELGEYNPFEVVSTNLTALQSLIESALDLGVERFVFTSSDKAVNPTNVMGGSKFIGERLVVAANGYRGPRRTIFCCTRFGNVLGSAGSVVPVFQHQIASGGPLTITEPEMTRFFMTLRESVDLVLTAAAVSLGGEIFIPKMHAVRLQDLAEAMIKLQSPARPIVIQRVGLRPGEKFYEELITDHEQSRCLELERLLIVLPYLKDWGVGPGERTHKPGPDDYPDQPRWTKQLFSSRTAAPLSPAAVAALLG